MTETIAPLPTTEPTRGASRPIASYGLLSDCNTAALAGSDGSIDWLCLPRYDSPAVFARILDPDAGHWSIRPAEPFTVQRRYLPGTLVIETTFTTETGTVRLLDAMALGEGERVHEMGMRVPHEMLRAVEGISGRTELEMELAPRPEYGLVRPLFRMEDGGGRTFGGPNRIAVRAGAEIEVREATMRAAFAVGEGASVGFSMRWHPPEDAHPQPPTDHADVRHRIEDVIDAWQSWQAEHEVYEGAHQDLVRMSSRVLKGLMYRPTGAIVAAPTTSLPESVGGERNWDYRFSWVRDSSLTLEALYIVAYPDEAEEFASFMTSSAGGMAEEGSMQIMYGIGGEHDLSERSLPHLRGWRDSAPVRVGNGAWDQVQLDVYGQLLNSLYVYRERLGELQPGLGAFVCKLADTAARRWRDADAGMWEMRGEPRHHLSSKVLCWTALDRALKLAPRLGVDEDEIQEWTVARDEVREAVLSRGWSEKRQAYAQSFDSDELDAAQLLMPIMGFLPATDPRMRSTIEAISRELTEDGLVLRYRTEAG